MDSRKRYFTFWFSTLANGSEPLYVVLNEKENYIFTKRVAEQHGRISEGWDLRKRVERIFEGGA